MGRLIMKINNPHDLIFKETMGDLNVFKDFILNYLPEELINRIDINDIQIVKDSFIEKELREVFSDLLYKINIDKQKGYIYFLFEHKSYPHKLITIQLLKYILNIWELIIKQKETDDLPVIIPLVFYHGRQKWTVGTNLQDIVEDVSDEFQKYIPDYQYILYDISYFSDEQLKGEIKLRIFLKLFSHIFKDDFEIKLKEIIKLFENLAVSKTDMDYFECVIRYIMNARDDLSLSKLKKVAREVSIERGEKIMTIAEHLRKEGKIEGKIEGIIEGIEVALELKYGKQALELMNDIKKINDLDRIEGIKEIIRVKDSFDEVKEVIYKN